MTRRTKDFYLTLGKCILCCLTIIAPSPILLYFSRIIEPSNFENGGMIVGFAIGFLGFVWGIFSIIMAICIFSHYQNKLDDIRNYQKWPPDEEYNNPNPWSDPKTDFQSLFNALDKRIRISENEIQWMFWALCSILLFIAILLFFGIVAIYTQHLGLSDWLTHLCSPQG